MARLAPEPRKNQLIGVDPIFTVGHSTRGLAELLRIVAAAGVEDERRREAHALTPFARRAGDDVVYGGDIQLELPLG